MRKIRKNFPQLVLIDLIDKRMESALINYFEELENAKSPLEIISLYQEYQNYVPDDQKGQNIVRAVIGELEKLDLLEQAADLMSRLIARLKEGEEKTNLILKAAKIHNDNRSFESAMTLLSQLPKELPLSLAQQRSLLLADSFIGLGKKEQAIKTLSESTDVILVRRACDVLISDKNWEEAGEKLAMTVNLYDEEREAEEKKRTILDLALVLRIQDKIVDLEVLRKVHGKYMESVPLFGVITNPSKQGEINREKVLANLKDLETLKKFIEEIK